MIRTSSALFALEEQQISSTDYQKILENAQDMRKFLLAKPQRWILKFASSKDNLFEFVRFWRVSREKGEDYRINESASRASSSFNDWFNLESSVAEVAKESNWIFLIIKATRFIHVNSQRLSFRCFKLGSSEHELVFERATSVENFKQDFKGLCRESFWTLWSVWSLKLSSNYSWKF